MQQIDYIKSPTKTFAIVNSVLIVLAIIVVFIIGIAGQNFVDTASLCSNTIVFFTAIFIGSMQIKVFGDYKKQNKSLCADGIFYICLAVLISITNTIAGIMNNQLVASGIIMVFASMFAFWKFIMFIIALKLRAHNALLELIVAFTWGMLGVANGMGATDTSAVIAIGASYAICIFSVVYMLYSYVFREPRYLATEKGYAIALQQQADRQRRQSMFDTGYANTAPQSSSTAEDKLAKLKSLHDKGFITDQEYSARKSAILDQEL